MNLLLDTHIALWAITDSPRLSPQARDLIQAARTTVWISTASVWEIAIKHSLGRGDMPVSGQDAEQAIGDFHPRNFPQPFEQGRPGPGCHPIHVDEEA